MTGHFQARVRAWVKQHLSGLASFRVRKKLPLHLNDNPVKTIKAELLCIGDELLYGQILDTNAQWMAVALSDAGIKVVWKTTVGDVEADILDAFARAEARADIVLISGGLGPTSDDLTKPCMAKYFDCPIALHPEALADVTAFFKQRGRELTDINRKQAELPVCCDKVTNRVGTAPGMLFERNGKVFVSMPGVPHELKIMMTELVVPELKRKFQPPAIHHTVIRTAGIGESFLAEKIRSWERSLPSHFRLAYLPGVGDLRLRLTALGNDSARLEAEATALVEKLKVLAGEFIYAFGESSSLEAAVGNMLKERGLTLATAESCTGGYLSHLLTSVPGSSAYFTGGILAYANTIKEKELGVRAETLSAYGAVSEEAALEMASGVRRKLGTDIGVATTGIAGPGGGTAEKPVGMVWIAYDDGQRATARKLNFSNERMLNIRLASMTVLNLIRLQLVKPART